MAGDRPYEELMEQAEALLQQGGLVEPLEPAAASDEDDGVAPVLLPMARDDG